MLDTHRSIRQARAVIAVLLVTGPALAQALATLGSADSPEVLPEASWRSDLQQARREFLDRDRSYRPEARAAAEKRLAAFEARRGEMPTIELAIELARIAALADNGHTLASAGPRVADANRVATINEPSRDASNGH